MDPNQLLNIVGVASIGIIVSLVVFIISSTGKAQEAQSQNQALRRDLRDTEEQAKLLVQTNIELNRIQEEANKKLNDLACLHTLSRSLSSPSKNGQVADKITLEEIESLGFEKALAFLFEEATKKAYPLLALGYTENEMPQIQAFIGSNRESFLKVIGEGKPLSSQSQTDKKPFQESLRYNLKLDTYILAPVQTKEGDRGFIFVGRKDSGVQISLEEEKALALLGEYLAQAIDNARAMGKGLSAHYDAQRTAEEKTRQSAEMLEEMQKIKRGKSQAILTISRRLKDQLVPVKDALRAALEEKGLSEWAGPKLNEADRKTNEAFAFLGDLVELSTLELKTAGLVKQSHELSKLAQEAVDSMPDAIKEKQLQVLLEFPRNAEVAFFDLERIRRVFRDLVGNAVKYSPMQGSITIKSKKDENMVQIDITDTGCGIPAADIGGVFEEFYRADNPVNQKIPGAGLSLALAKSIIEAHGGKIWVETAFGSGSTFSFTLSQ